jgi:diadenosine tetraphosphate (Ap4A) HIT family hydrolase
MERPCRFCARDPNMQARTFYEDDHWFACLAAPPNLRGHAIIAAKNFGECPRTLTEEVLSGIHKAVAEVSRILTAHYRPKHVLFASLRVKDPHIHAPLPRDSEARGGVAQAEGCRLRIGPLL